MGGDQGSITCKNLEGVEESDWSSAWVLPLPNSLMTPFLETSKTNGMMMPEIVRLFWQDKRRSRSFDHCFSSLPGGNGEELLDGVVSKREGVRWDAIVEGNARLHVFWPQAVDTTARCILLFYQKEKRRKNYQKWRTSTVTLSQSKVTLKAPGFLTIT